MMTPKELQALAKETLDQMLHTLEIHADCQVIAQEEEEQETPAFSLALDTKEAGRIIGKKGQTQEALELLLNRILKRKDEDAPWIPILVDGRTTGKTGDVPKRGRDGRRPILDDETVDQLTRMAQDCAKEVRHWKKSRKLGPYLPAERRIIHTALKDDPQVETNSIPAPEAGERMKYVEISLKA